MITHEPSVSSFLLSGSSAQADSLAVLHLKRDLLLPTVLREQDDEDEGYDEGKVTNSRFGSFPHSTLIGVPWGSQILASAVDTGSRGRRAQNGTSGRGLKRKRGTETVDGSPRTPDVLPEDGAFKAAVTASSGFAHLLPPTPESWTSSLPHRTQVVYTPDYSYVLQRLRVGPGSQLIEAGAGSGSFTHAAARAVFNGHSSHVEEGSETRESQTSKLGRVWSYEFHEQREEKLRNEIKEHGLADVVRITHRDVCSDGFFIEAKGDHPINADAVFLDLPAPWLALEHLTRDIKTTMEGTEAQPIAVNQDRLANPCLERTKAVGTQSSILNPEATVRICTFSPCIEQVQRTVTTMRQLGWLEVEMVEVAAKRIDARRERVGLQEEGLRGVHATAASVDEAVTRLRQLEGVTREAHESSSREETVVANEAMRTEVHKSLDGQDEAAAKTVQAGRKLYKEGALVHRAEPDIKTHTSYLVFAILPQAWTEEDERSAQQLWTPKVDVSEHQGKLSKRQQKKLARSRRADVSVDAEANKEISVSSFTAREESAD